VEKVKGGPKDFYDITVPETGCYFSNGIIHHNTGKSFFDVIHVLSLYSKYNGHPFTGIIASSTMKRLRQTLLLDLSAILKSHKIKFEYNKQENELTIGTLKFIIINMELPEDIFGINASVAICIHSRTLIHTLNRGDIPICKIAAGDIVLTRAGYRPVLAARRTGFRGTEAVGGGRATPEHLVLTSRGFCAVRDLTESDELHILDSGGFRLCVQAARKTESELARLSILWERGTTATPIRTRMTSGIISGAFRVPEVMIRELHIIALCGRALMARFPMDMLFIIRTGILLITIYLISSAWSAALIFLTTIPKKSAKPLRKDFVNTRSGWDTARWSVFARIAGRVLQRVIRADGVKNVIPRQNEGLSRKNSTARGRRCADFIIKSASIAAKSSTPHETKRDFAVKSVRTLFDLLTDKPQCRETGKSAFVRFAERSLKLLASLWPLRVLINAVRKSKSKPGWVYDLQVDGSEFCFKSGLVVHNCDELDTLPAEKSIAAFTKIQERTRKVLPDGREPYIVVSSTANGLKGCYLLYKKFIAGKIPFCIARGSTSENPYFAKSSLKMLESLYNDKEKRALIHGEFVNLNVGRVYPEFDPKTNVYMDFSIKASDTLYCGLDFNQGYNANCVIINRDGTLYIVSEFKHLIAGDVPRTIRKMYPENEIILIPDASGKEIMRGYLGECEENDIQIMIPRQNPGISERVLCVNKLFRMKRLWVMQKCEGIITGLEIRGFDEQTGEPEKRRGENSPCHYMDSVEYATHYIINNSGGFEALIELINFQSANRRETKYMSAEGLKRYANYKKQAG
jgi:hypothetical protein